MSHIEILFKEYDTLRTELIARQSGIYQLTLISGAVFAWFLSHASGNKLWLTLGALIVLFVLLLYRAITDMLRIAHRLQELEEQINQLAGAELLKWESHASAWAEFARKQSLITLWKSD